MRRVAWSWRHMFCRNSLRHNGCVYIMTMTQPSIFAYFACCPLWGRRCPPIPESYWKKRALKHLKVFFPPMASHNMHFNRFSGIYLSVIQQKLHQLRLMGSVIDCLPHLPWTKSSSPIDIPKERRRQDLRLGSERHYEFDPTGAKSCRLLDCLKERGRFRGWVGLEKNQESFWFTYVYMLIFSCFFKIWFWGFFGFWICFQPSDVQGMEKPWQEDHYDALAQLLEKTNEAEWPWQKTKRIAL